MAQVDKSEIDPKLLALHRHWCAADSIKYVLFATRDDTATAAFRRDVGEEVFALSQFQSTAFRLSVFYGLLYVVVEGYQELGCKEARVDELLGQAEFVDALRRFRNAMFHYQKDPLSPKVLEFLEKTDSEKWTQGLHAAFNAFFRARLPIDEMLAAMKTPP